MENFSQFYAAGSIALILPLVNAIKNFVKDSRYYPLIAVGIGIVFNLIVGAIIGEGAAVSLFQGIIAGMAACGIYSAVPTKKE